MTCGLDATQTLWRVGYRADPLGFAPRDIYEFSHRFDDIQQRFRTLYCADLPETCLREVLADFRPNPDAVRRYLELYGAEAVTDIRGEPVTAEWRRQNVLAPVRIGLDGPLVDLIDVASRQQVEDRHRELLLEHDLQHLDLHEITTSRRVVTQTIAADLYDRGVAAVRFPSRLDGNACVALFEGRGRVDLRDARAVALTDPPPQALTTVAGLWRLALEPAAATDGA